MPTLVIQKLLELVGDHDDIHVYNEAILRDGSYVRAHPNYRGEGAWYDFVNVQWEEANDTSYLLPAQCLAFYKSNGQCMAIVQSVDIDSIGRVNGYSNSLLTTHYHMQCNRTGVPTLYTVNCASIDSTVLAIDHDKAGCVLATNTRRSVMVVRSRNEWAYAWVVWNRYLKVKNNNRTQAKPFVDLGTESMITKVRKLVEESLAENRNG